jgi:hypothetical protein
MKSHQAKYGEIIWKRHHLHLKIGRAVGLTNSAFSWKFVYGIMLGTGPIWLQTIRFAQIASSKENQMSIFPTKILLATDGSKEARLAARTAVDLAQKTLSEVHLIHVFDVALIALLYPEATDQKGVKVPEAILEEDLQRHAREVLDGEVKRVRSAGGTVAQSYLMMGEVAREIVHLDQRVK